MPSSSRTQTIDVSQAYLEGLNADQIKAVQTPVDQPLQILAGAGTGKTELISRRFIKISQDLQQQGVQNAAARILVLTFTSDAAASMKQRIQSRLSAFSNATALPPEELWISNFHQFCMRLLKPHAIQMGLAPGFSLIDPVEQVSLFQSIADNLLAGQGQTLASWNQRTVIQGLSTEVLSHHALKKVDRDCLQSLLDGSVLVQIIGRIKATGWTPEQFHTYARQQSKALTQHLINTPIGFEEGGKALDNIQQALLAWRSHFKNWVDDEWQPLEEPEQTEGKLTASVYKKQLPDFVSFFLQPRTFAPKQLDKEAISILTEIADLELTVIDILTAIYCLYQELLLQRNACDFDDLINHTIVLLKQNPAICRNYQNYFKAIIVDEFQDSNGSQLALLELLLQPGASNLTAVGDDKQSIYGFRFAQPENLDLIFSSAQSPQVVHLQTNYRSSPAILHLANQITECVSKRANQALFPCAENKMINDDVEWMAVSDDEVMETFQLEKSTMEAFKTLEAQKIVDKIQYLNNAKQVSYGDVAVLVSSHEKAERLFNTMMAARIPAVRQKSLTFFAEPIVKDALAVLRLIVSPHDMVSLTRLLQKKLSDRQLKELISAYREWKKEFSSLADKETSASTQQYTLLLFCQQATQHFHKLPALPAVYGTALEDFANGLASLISRRNRVYPAELFKQLAVLSGIDQVECNYSGESWRYEQQKLHLETFEKLLSVISSQLGSAAYSIRKVLEKVEGYVSHPEQPLPVQPSLGQVNAVKIMTTFAAKGLEFPVVFLAACEQPSSIRGSRDSLLFEPQHREKAGFGLMVSKLKKQKNLKRHLLQKAWQYPQNKREVLRLFYVAVTRAKKQLIIVYCSQSAEWTKPDYWQVTGSLAVNER